MNFGGINGERAFVIERILRGEAMKAETIAYEMWRNYPDLLNRHGRIETVQAVLREMEHRGRVTRTRSGRHDIWSTA